MAVGKEIKVVLTLDNNGFMRGTRASADAVQQMTLRLNAGADAATRLERRYSSFGGRLQRLVTTLGMARFALMDINDIFLAGPAAIMKTAGEIERLTKLMQGLSQQSTETGKKLEAASNVKFLFEMAQNAPFQVTALADAFVKLKTGGIDPVNGSLAALVDSVAKFGGNSDLLHRAGIAIQQMGGKGVVSMEELRQQLGEAVPTAIRDMAAGIGMTMAELTNKIKKGTVEAASALNKMLGVMRTTNAGGAAALMDTWTGLLERLKTRWTLFQLDIANAGMFDTAKQAVEDLLAEFNRASTGSLARDIGRFLNDVTVGVVNLTRQIVKMWDWIVIAGKAFLFYWAAARIAPAIAGAVTGIQTLKTTLLAKHTATMAAIAAEQQAERRAAVEDTARMQKQRAEFQAMMAERLRLKQVELRSVQYNHAAIVAEEAKLHAELRALRAAEVANNVNNIGSQAVLIRQMDDLRGRKHQLANAERALQVEVATTNKVIAQGVPTVAASTAAINGANAAIIAGNAHMATAAGRTQVLTSRMSGLRVAASMMGSAVSAATTWIKGMIFSFNGLILVIMAAAAAYDYFSSKARRAAHDAATAARMQELTRRGTAQQDDVESAKRDIEVKKKQIDANRKELERLARMEKMPSTADGGKAVKNRIDALEKENLDLIARVDRSQREVFEAEKQVLARNAEMHSQDLLQMVNANVDRSLQPYQARLQKIEAELTKANGDGDKIKQLKAERSKVLKEAEASRLTALADKKKEYEAVVANANSTQEQILAAKRALEGIARLEAEVNHWLGVQDQPNVFVTAPGDGKKDKKGKGRSKGSRFTPTDDLLEKIKEDQTAVLQARGLMDKVNTDLVDLADLRAQATREIDQIIEQDRHKQAVHTEVDREKAIDQLTNRKVIQEALAQMRVITPRLEEAKTRLSQLQKSFASGDLESRDSSEENRYVRQLQRLAELAPQASKEWDQVIARAKEWASVGANIDLTRAMMDNERDLRRLRVDVIEDDRARNTAAYNQQVADVNAMYDRLTAQASEYNLDLNRLAQERSEHLKLINEKFAQDMRTPMEAMAREWKNVDRQLDDLQTRWADGFVTMLVNGATGAGMKVGDYIKGILTDVLTVRLKQVLADPLTKILGAGTDWLKGAMNVGLKGDNTAGVATFSAATTRGATVVETFSAAVRNAITALTNFASNLSTGTPGGGGSFGVLDDLVGGLFGDGGGVTPPNPFFSAGVTPPNPFFFADGGVMTDMGRVPLRKYARGGIANYPQAAVFGDGDTPEAYVPLPDGNSIPVTVQGGLVPDITINVINQSGQPVASKQGQTRVDGKQMVLDIVLTAANQPGSFRDGMKTAMKS